MRTSTPSPFRSQFAAFALLNLGVGLAACYALGRALSPLFADGDWLCHAATSILLLNPVTLAQMIQPSLDFALAMLTAFLLAALLSGHLLAAVVIGILMTSTKEPGIMLYGVTMIGYMSVIMMDIAKVSRLKEPFIYAAKHWYVALPLFAFFLYSQLFGLHGGSWGQQEISLTDVAGKLFTLSPNIDLLIAQAASLFVLNFNWILSLCVIVALAVVLWNPRMFHLSAFTWFKAVVAALLLGMYFHTRVLLWNNPRYVLPLFVLMLAASIIAYSQFWARFPRLAVAVLLVYLPLLIGSQFRTVDPLSKIVFRPIRFGSHVMLSTGGFRKFTEHGGYEYHGRDQLVYNLQFTKFSELAEKAVREFGLDKRYVAGPVFTGWDDFRRYDVQSMKRSMRPNAGQIDFSTFDQLFPSFAERLRAPFVYLEFPNVLNEAPIDALRQHYHLAAVHTVASGGYSISAYEFDEAKTPALGVIRRISMNPDDNQ